ncbi:G-patch domain and KOW motifs-containing protein [Protopterus annectens]|uniref:G-patch domain and KOW motifs-containing protein n=1 Tax=Protopterus annectens TaxID=7888 RepID=UPI001CF972FF|nr:G-patch domain and KOW motifs-containing protein [Protopterus annectens]
MTHLVAEMAYQGVKDSAGIGNIETKKPLSFSFSKTVNRLKIPATAKLEGSGSGSEETTRKDYVTAVEGKELQSVNPVEKPKELVIPLIQKNRWKKKGSDDRQKERTSEKEQEEDHVVSQAIQELIDESQKHKEQWNTEVKDNPNLKIPLLLQNRVPDGFEDGDKINVELRPDQSTDTDYETVPVDAYGMAMLRGMGWKEGEGIGRTFKQDVKPIEHQLRPKGLGLGADRSALHSLEESKPKRPLKPGEERGDEEPKELTLGSLVQLDKGPHKEMYGKVEGVDPDNARVMVKLAVGGKIVTVSQHGLRLVNKKEYEKYGKDLSRLSKAHKENQKREMEEKERLHKSAKSENQSKETSRSGDSGKHSSKHSNRDQDIEKQKEKKERKRKHETNSDSGHTSSKESKTASRECGWLRRDLKVRFIDKHYKGGKFYNSKMTVEDVLSPETCICRTEEGQLLEGIKQSMLETVIPKREFDKIMVVLGEHRGLVGRILQRDRERYLAIVQLDRYEDSVFKLDYDSLCHYIGAPDD